MKQPNILPTKSTSSDPFEMIYGGALITGFQRVMEDEAGD